MAAVVPSATGAALVTFVCCLPLVAQTTGKTIRGDAAPGDSPDDLLFSICYAPLLLWGPLLAVLTVAYFKRRRDGELR
ncbi:hypothetical protein [Streptomyces sp. NPDC101166]|uniref:hypothetical protein n=1 Tax=Streptomyces sp. NPDC101166 TaxID=3366120 RepID=UPI003811D94E